MKPAAKFLHFIKPFLNSRSLSTIRRGQEMLGKIMVNPYKNNVEYEDFRIDDLECSVVTPKDEVSSGIVLYLHGGGYTSGHVNYSKAFATILAAKCGIKVMCAAYRLAPEEVFPAALEDSLEAYGYLLSKGYSSEQILLCGESAGGGLCYSLCLKLKEKGWMLPAGIIAVSPWTDLTASGKSYELNKKTDPYMTEEQLKFYADCYLYGQKQGEDVLVPETNSNRKEDSRIKQNPLVSPLFGDLSKMPPSIIFVGSDEIMLDDAVLMHGKLNKSDCESELHIADGMWHGYLLYGLKENDNDFVKISRFIKKHIPAQKKLRWMTLDNAAKIFPASRSRTWSNVFRLSATLNEKIDTEALKTALDVTVRRFPSIAVRVKTGFFWYYLEEIPKAPDIMEEKPYPLSRMPFDDVQKCAFRVIVHEKRIAVEFFHALTDGNGGLIFMKTLVAEYLYQKYGVRVPVGNGVLDRLEEPKEEELEDSFFKYAGPVAASRADTNAFRIKGLREADGYKTNTTFILSASEVVEKAKKLNVTVTVYIVAALMTAIMEIQKKKVKNPKRYKPAKVLIPVNLRKIFPSKTLRNFILYVTPSIEQKLGEYSFEEICASVSNQMKLTITPQNMASMIAKNVGDEKPLILRATPLFLKNFVMKMVFNAVGERKSCFCFSNLGVVNMPDEFSAFVDRMDFVLGVQAKAPYNTSAITYKDKIYLNIIRNMEMPVLEPELYGVFKKLGIKVRVESNTRIKERK